MCTKCSSNIKISSTKSKQMNDVFEDAFGHQNYFKLKSDGVKNAVAHNHCYITLVKLFGLKRLMLKRLLFLKLSSKGFLCEQFIETKLNIKKMEKQNKKHKYWSWSLVGLPIS